MVVRQHWENSGIVGVCCMRKGYIINGRQLIGNVGGVQRYLREILYELDVLIQKDEVSVIVPKDAESIPSYKNLKIIRYGSLNGLLWENLCLPWYLFTRRKLGINLCTVVPFLYPFGIVAIHDVMICHYKEMNKAMKFLPRILLKLNYWVSTHFSKAIITVSQTSKNDICNYYHINPQKISIIPNAWQHIHKIQSDNQVFNKFPFLTKCNFYLALSANRWQKNFKWIIEVAKRNLDKQFAIVGEKDQWQKNELLDSDNVHVLGYLSDSEIKALYKNCKAFIFPSICEGFGIPPLEAMSVGAKIIVSNTSCLPEIFEKSAYYINPFDYDVDLNILLKDKVEKPELVLNKFSWKLSAEKLFSLMCK